VRVRLSQAEIPAAFLLPQQAVTRSDQGDTVLVLHNLKDHAVRGWGNADVEAVSLEPVLVDWGVEVTEELPGSPSFTLPPHATGIWRVRATGHLSR